MPGKQEGFLVSSEQHILLIRFLVAMDHEDKHAKQTIL